MITWVVVFLLLVVLGIGGLVLRRKMGAAIALAIIGVVVAVFARPIEIIWDDIVHSSVQQAPPATEAGSNQLGPSHVVTPSAGRSDTGVPTPTAVGVATTSSPDGPPGPDITPSRAPEIIYLADMSRTSGGVGIFSEGSVTIRGKDYLHSVYSCMELSWMANINCNSDKTESWWAEYVAPDGMRYLHVALALSDRSPGDCRVAIQMEVGGQVVFDTEVLAGDLYDRKWTVAAGARVVFRVRPVAGTGRCFPVLGDARFVQ